MSVNPVDLSKPWSEHGRCSLRATCANESIEIKRERARPDGDLPPETTRDDLAIP
jgi:hypothetical protein